jgi:hypothetical protein
MDNESKLDLRNFKVDQFGYVYRDIEKQAQILETYLSVPKFNFMPPFVGCVNYRGKETEITIRIGFSRNFNMQIELIQPIEGQCIYTEFLDQGKEGLHHINCSVENVEAQIDQIKNLGYEVVQSGVIVGNRRFAYFDTEKILGIILEIQGTVKKRKEKG